MSSEFNGTSISGNASVFILGYSLNFSYKKNKSLLRLFSGGQYISQNKTEVSNSAFSQLRYDYQINYKSRYFMFTQLQSNAILLFNKRLLGGLGYRRNLINIERDSSSKINFDLSLGVMQEEEVLKQISPATKRKILYQLYKINFFYGWVLEIQKEINYN